MLTDFDMIEIDEDRWYPDMWRDAWNARPSAPMAISSGKETACLRCQGYSEKRNSRQIAG